MQLKLAYLESAFTIAEYTFSRNFKPQEKSKHSPNNDIFCNPYYSNIFYLEGLEQFFGKKKKQIKHNLKSVLPSNYETYTLLIMYKLHIA